MYKIKKGLALLLIVLGLPLTANAQSVTDAAIFTDVSVETPNSGSIQTLKDEQIIHGYADGTFKPGYTINRAEFATLITNSLEIKTEGENCFSDVHSEWFAGPICSLKTKGILNGYPDGSFQPGRNINVVEAAKILVKANQIQEGTGTNWFEPFIKGLEGKNAIPVSVDSLDQKLSRAEVAEMIYRIHENETSRTSKTLVSLNQEMPTISSCAELSEKIAEYQYKNGDYFLDDVMMPEEGVSDSTAIKKESATSAPDSTESVTNSGSTSDEYSTTNLQVENVDESDVMKNNGSHIYFIQGQNVKVVKAYPADEMAEEANIKPEDNFYPSSIYLNGTTLVIMGNGSMGANYTSATNVYIYDVSNPKEPKKIRTLQFSGYEISSRRIGDNLYLVLNQYQPYYYYKYYDRFAPTTESSTPQNIEESLPSYYDSSTGATGKMADCNNIIYFPHPRSMDYLIVAGIPLNNANKSINKQVILGNSENVYASSDNLYVASTSYEYPEYSIYDSWEITPQKYSYNNTLIHKFSMDNGQVTFEDKGKVPGRIINQFSMDEHEDTFRIATTSDGSRTTNNNLYILNKNNLDETLGKIEGIAPGENIYSTRFVGDKAYMVTFKTTDPLFVIDTSDVHNPKILGKLKIPGYSNYLQPFDENHIIGLGKEAEVDKSGNFAWYKGIKLALFDISDVNNPVELSNVVIGDRGSDSEALNNHKAILFSKEKGFIAFPITIAEKKAGDTEPSSYGEFTFQGAQVYNVSTTNGLTLRGSITHYSPNTDEFLKAADYWWPHTKDIKRILYIGDNFYTVSDAMIKASNMETLKEQNKIELEVTNQDYYNNWDY